MLDVCLHDSGIWWAARADGLGRRAGEVCAVVCRTNEWIVSQRSSSPFPKDSNPDYQPIHYSLELNTLSRMRGDVAVGGGSSSCGAVCVGLDSIAQGG